MTSFKQNGIGRRQFLRATAIGATALATPGIIRRAYAQDDHITIFTWETYHDDAWIQEWTEHTGIRVSVVRTGGVDEMFAMANSGAVPADVFYIDSGSIRRYRDADLIVPIDIAQLPEAANIAPGLNYQALSSLDGDLYGVPYNWGTQPLMFDEDVVTDGTDSWDVLWDPRYAGKVNLFDDAYITFPMIALKIGAKDPFNLTDAEFDACRQALVELRRQVRTIARGFNDAETLYAAGDASLGYCQNISIVFNLQNRGRNFNYSFPRQGTPTWIDNAVVSKSGNRPAVYRFLNDNLTIPWQSRFIEASLNNGILSEAGAREGGVSDGVLTKTNIIDQSQDGFWDKMVVFMFPEDIDRRVQMWNDFKAGIL